MHRVGNPITYYHFRDTFPYGGNDTTTFSTRSPWKMCWYVGAFATGHVGVVDSDGFKVNYSFSWPCYWIWSIFQFQNLGSANFVSAYRFHIRLPFCNAANLGSAGVWW